MVKQAWVQIQLFELEYNNKIVYENVCRYLQCMVMHQGV